MLCLSLWPPWGSLVAASVKRVETRPKPPNGLHPRGVRPFPGKAIRPGERIAIHQTLRVPREVYELIDSRHGDELRAICEDALPEWRPRQRNLGLRLGQVLCTVQVAAAWPMYRPDEVPFDVEALEEPYLEIDGGRLTLQPAEIDLSHEIPLGHYDTGRWGWSLEAVEVVDDDTTVQGHQGIWEVECHGS